MRLANWLLFGLAALNCIPALAINKECERLLGQSAIIRHFRRDADTTRTGTWYNVHGRMVFVPNDPNRKATTLEGQKNFAAHAEILRRQVGDERFSEIVSSSSSPQEGFEAELSRQAQESAKEIDLEGLKARISLYGADADLPQELEDEVMAAIRQFERLATPLSDWLRPKVLNRRLGQLPQSSFTDSIKTWISPRVKVHKANLVTVRLNGVKRFIISSSFYESPDSYHRSSMAFLDLMLPKERLVQKETPGYLVIRAWDEDLLNGEIQFVIKGSHEVIFRESYSF